MSKINVDTWEPESGTAATLMASGDTVTLPDGAIFAVASGGDINVASGGEIDIASGATLDVNGTIDLTGATKTGFPAGGLTTASQWRLTTTYQGDATPIASNLIQANAPVGFGVLGSSMTESSGVFTFPSTGYWYILFKMNGYGANNVYGRENHGNIYTTIDNTAGPTWAWASDGIQSSGQSSGYEVRWQCMADYIFDVTDVAECKVRFHSDTDQTDTRILGHADYNRTSMTFLRLADT